MADMIQVRNPNLPAERAMFSGRDLVYVAFRRKAWIFAVWLPILALGALGLFKQTGAYVAGSKVLLELQSAQAPSLVLSTSRNVDYDLSISTYSALAMSVPVAEIAAVTLRDSIAVLEAIDPRYASLANEDRMLEFILDKLDVVRVGESSLLDIRYTSPYEKVALMVDRAVRDAFLTYSLSTGKNSRAVSYYDEQVREAETDIDSLLAQRERVSRQTGISIMDQDVRSGTDLMRTLEEIYYEVSASASQYESEAGSLQAAVAENPDFVPIGQDAANLNSMRIRVEDEDQAYYKLLADHPEGSQAVQRQTAILTDLKADLRGAVSSYIQGKVAEGKALRDKAAAVKHQMETVEGSLADVPDAYRRITMLDAQISAKGQFLEGIQIKAGEVRLAQMADDRVSRLTKITEPEIDTVIAESRKFAYFGVIAASGLLLGLLVGVIVDRSDRRIHDARVLSEVVEVPVLGSISVPKR